MELCGLDIGGSKIAGVVFNPPDGVGDKRIVAEVWREHSGSAAKKEEIIGVVLAVLVELRGAHTDEVQTIGIGVPGPVDADQTKVLVAPHLPALNGLELPRLIAEKTGLKIVIDNDVRAAALGELRYGRAGDSFIFISIGTGIGSAIVEHGEISRGHGHELSAGEIGHMRLREGKTFEALASQQFLATTSWRDIKTFLSALAAGDPAARKTAVELAQGLGEGLGNVINAFDPAAIVLAGGLANAWTHLEATVREVIRSVVLSPEARETPIKLATFGRYAGAVGAAALTA